MRIHAGFGIQQQKKKLKKSKDENIRSTMLDVTLFFLENIYCHLHKEPCYLPVDSKGTLYRGKDY